MSERPGTVKEALVAELLGDVHLLIERVEKADASAKATAQALNEATASYRTQVDELTERLRSETTKIIIQTTEHAAQSLVSQQASTLQKAATQAMGKALTAKLLKRTWLDWLTAAMIGGLAGAVVCTLFVLLWRV
jgi:vacuolar-type H+-ATPase subunit H